MLSSLVSQLVMVRNQCADMSIGKFKGIETMVTSRIHIDDITEKGFNELMTNKDQHIKILVTPDRSKLTKEYIDESIL
jgi:threonine dehydrogenase-like Zn-dependent dehydrogenase